jgi:23S rRNA pseudouridine955/2504/2580 synthase
VPARAAKRGAAKGAVTRFEVVERFADTTLVRAVPFTGRTHQIRVHAWATGHPLAVDPVYGEEVPPGAREPLAGLEGLSLHAHRYTLPPDWDEPRSFTCPLTEGFRAALAALRSGARCGGDSPSL